MAPKLYTVPASPPVRAVLMTAKAIGLELDVQFLNLMEKEHLTPAFLKLNPQHTIPTLVDDDGFAIWDSHAIMTYIVGKYAKDDSLYPKDLRKRAIVDQRLHFESGVIFAELRRIFKPIFAGERSNFNDADLEAFNTLFDFLESFLENKAWFAGDSVTVADISIFSSLSSINMAVPIKAEKHPKLAAWLSKFAKRPESEENEEGKKALWEIWKSKLH